MPEAGGTVIGPYRIVEPIGSGGFSTVYRAVDDRLESEVAIKVLAENHSLDADIRTRFLSESRLLRRVASDHVIRVLDIGETERLQPYLVMEYAGGGDLAQRVQRVRSDGGTPEAHDLEVVARALGAALGALHAGGIVHRDVSPGNLLLVTRDGGGGSAGTVVGRDERVVLADLGYAKDLEEHSGLTVGGGTRGFRAPEQRDGFGKVDQRADIFSASAVLAWMVTGEPPERFESDRPDRQLRSAGVLAALADVLGRGMAVQPTRRQEDIATWVSAVGAALRQEVTDRAPAVAPAPSARRPRRSRPRALAWAAAALAVVALAAGIGGFALAGGTGQMVDDLGDDRVRVSVTEGNISAAIFGPRQIVVGETARFEAGVAGGQSYAWVVPGGEIVASVPAIELTGRSERAVTVRLLVTGGDGHVVTVAHTVDVVAAR